MKLDLCLDNVFRYFIYISNLITVVREVHESGPSWRFLNGSGSGSAYNECGSATLLLWQVYTILSIEISQFAVEGSY
jgi:hypothetical protein